MDEKPFGIAKRDIKKDEVIATISGSGVTSDNIEFLPGGREILLKSFPSFGPGIFTQPLLPKQRKETTMKKAKEFKERILMQFRNTSKKSWDRKEITRKVMDLWTEFLEKQIEKGRR